MSPEQPEQTPLPAWRQADESLPSRSESATASDLAAQIVAYLIAGPLTFGLLGWALDHALHVGWLTPLGVLLGVALSMYLIWFRYGRT